MKKGIYCHKENCPCSFCKAKRGELIGKNNPFYGRHHTEESKQKSREKHLGWKNPHKNKTYEQIYGLEKSIEMKRIMRAQRIGKISPLKGLKGKPSKRKGLSLEQEYGIERAKEIRKKQSDIKKGKRFSESTRKRMSESRSGVKSYNYGKKMTQEQKQKISKKRIELGLARGEKNPMWSKHHSEESKRKNSETHKRLCKNPEHVKKIMSSANIRPNGLELYLDYLLQNYFPDEWKYVGDGQEIINGLCPDFINVGGKKKIIELFGDFWHINRVKTYTDTEEGRKRVFSSSGYDTLIIWDSELKNEQKLIKKIRDFVYN